MANFTDMTGLVGVASAATATLLFLPAIARLPRSYRAILLGAVFVLLLIPFAGMPLAAYVRGATGDLSITTLALLWCALLKPWFNSGMADTRARYTLLVLIALAALALYPMALGVGAFDPYRLGYGDPLFVSMLCIALATLAWAIGWYESDNLWDYLLDPFVSFYALAAVMTYAVKALWRQGGSRESQPTIRG
jgi:hypothetical protein